MTLARRVAAVVLTAWLGACSGPAPPGPPPPPAADDRVERAFAERASGVEVEVTATVERRLPDDREGLPHQRFLVRLPSGHTVLVAHNLDLAARVPVREGDRVTVRGEYEWNPKGGVIHWTHRDPRGHHQDGFIQLGDRRYQ